LTQAIPAVNDSLREELQASFTMGVRLSQFQVTLSLFSWKKLDYSVAEKPLSSLNSSMRSAPLHLSSNNHKPSWWSLSLYTKPLKFGNKWVDQCWTRSS